MSAEKIVKRPESSLPWKVCNNTPSGFKIISDTPYGGVVADTTNWWASTQGARDNAEFIVEACNSYDKLLELAEKALYELECLVPALDSFHQARNTMDELREITK